jgi:hypothetical protein
VRADARSGLATGTFSCDAIASDTCDVKIVYADGAHMDIEIDVANPNGGNSWRLEMVQAQCLGITFSELSSVPSDSLVPFTDQLPLAVAAYLASGSRPELRTAWSPRFWRPHVRRRLSLRRQRTVMR